MKSILTASKLHSQRLLSPVADCGRFPGISLLKNSRVIYFLAVFIVMVSGINCFAQDTAAKSKEYLEILSGRSAKIINTLGITDSLKYKELVSLVTSQYYEVNKIQDRYKEIIKEVKARQLSKEEKDSLEKTEVEKKSSRLLQLHNNYITRLSKNLSEEQVEKVKDGMTYNILHVTYNAYQEMLLGLTGSQKEKIYNWLKEARELAMDEGTSEDKHKVFGKYKGRINNYLSVEGYDMKKEEKEWQDRAKKKS